MKLLITFVAFVCAVNASAQILPKNNMRIPVRIEASGINKAQFDSILDGLDSEFRQIVASHRAKLQINHLWDNEDVNANAVQIGSTWQVNMFGGIARHPDQTPDGLRAVVCHELGHHLAGFPFVDDADWAANEGQADYYATQVCLRQFFSKTPELNALFGDRLAKVDPYAKAGCDRVWRNPADRAICHRTAMAGLALGKILASLGGSKISFRTPDRSVVKETDNNHPEAQCRLDTYFQGALCEADFNLYQIPGRSARGGQGSIQAEQAMAKQSCTRASRYQIGLRPRCWFFPRM